MLLQGCARAKQLIGTGGSTRALARLARRRRDYPIARLHGYVLDADTARALSEDLAARSLAERSALDGLRPARAGSIVGGAVILDELLRHLGANELTVAAGGLREGVATRVFGETVPQPRLVRAAAVEALLRRRGLWSRNAAAARASLADRLSADVSADPFSDVTEAARHAAMLRSLGETAGGGRAGR